MTRACRPSEDTVVKMLLIAIVALGCLGLAGFGVLAWRPVIAPVARPAPDSFAPELIAKGEALAGGGYCAECHTTKGGQNFAGGYAFATPFGVIYSTNITPDAETGIGSWSEAAFMRAMHEGVSRDGRHLYPAFPYTHFALMPDDDVQALYAYIMTRDPVAADVPQNDLRFPFNIRMLVAAWKALYFHPAAPAVDSSRGAEWNRGAYLVEGPA